MKGNGAGVAAAATCVLAALACTALAAPPKEYPIEALPAEAVTVSDVFWAPRMETNRTVSIPDILRKNEQTGRVDNFRRAAGRLEGPYTGKRYNDTDVYKAVEAASLSLVTHPDAALEARLDELVELIAAAQEPDGYIFTARTTDPEATVPGAGPKRWSWLHTSHELYNAGHLYEAAVAHHRATGKRTLLDVALKNAALLLEVFGPEGLRETPGHQEIELALVKLWRVTGDERLVELARFFLDQRGRPHTTEPHRFEPEDPFSIYNELDYRQDHQPVVEQTRARGHAVRATYMFAGMTDVATLLGIEAWEQTLRDVWRDVTGKRLYLTGGLGSQGRTEAFGDDYVLPNDHAYAETCASVGGVLWNHRMFLRSGDAAYLDVLERTLYNGYLSGASLSGDRYFYQNPLESDGSIERSEYFEVACCPANYARLMAQLPGLVYARRGSELFVNLFVGGELQTAVGGTALVLRQVTRYPWSGQVVLEIEPAAPVDATLALRIPGWARGAPVPSDLYHYAGETPSAPQLRVNGEAVGLEIDAGLARVERRWQPGDRVELSLPMRPRRVLAHEGVVADRGRAAIEMGPLVYAVEAIDNAGRARDLKLPLTSELTPTFREDLLGGVGVVLGGGVVAVPYYAWANRGPGEMTVWSKTE